jgi:hypothetical protein
LSTSFPTVLISRRPRQVDADWTGARSWLGGAPRIGAAPWPRDNKGQPQVFMAQIDLAEVAAKTGNTPLPEKGALAFFLGGEAAVVFVPEGESGPPVMPPAGTPDLSECGGSPEWRTDLSGQPLFPYWPVDFAVLDVTPPASEEDEDAWEAFRAAEAAAVDEHCARRQYILTADQAFTGPSIPDWWQTAVYYANYLDKALLDGPNLIKREQGSLEYARKQVEQAQSKGPADLKKAQAYVGIVEGKIAKLHQLQPAFAEFAAEVSGFSKGRDPWALMTPDEMAQLAALWTRNPEFAAFHFNQGKFPLDYLKKEMFKAVPAADTPAFADLPAHVRKLIDEKRAPRPQWWFMGVHFAKRLQDAIRLGVPNATKFRQNNIAAYRKRLADLQAKDTLSIFRTTIPKSADATKFEAEIAKFEAELAKLGQLEAAFKQFVEETRSWTQGRDPWTLMQPADVEQLDQRMKQAREEFRDFAASYLPHRRVDLETHALVTMASAEARGYAALPEAVRTLINRDYLLAPGGWHQMFGRGVEIQGDSPAMREDGYIMLLQLTHDDMMQWSFGDNGVYQFWISPADLDKRNWATVKMTFEMH